MRDGREEGSNHGAAMWVRETQKRRPKSMEAFPDLRDISGRTELLHNGSRSHVSA